MDRYTYETKFWLDLRFDPAIHEAYGLPYRCFQPVHGVRDGEWGPGQFLMASRWARLLHHLSALQPESFLDLGGAEGVSAHLVQGALGADVVSADLSLQACLRAREHFGLDTAAVDAARLPFADDSFDVVYMSEVIEHLAHPVRTLLELRRVARKACVITTEAFARNEPERRAELASRRLDSHMDRSITTPADVPLVFPGWQVLISNQCARIPDPMPQEHAAVQQEVTRLIRAHDLPWPAEGLFTLLCAEHQPTLPGPQSQRHVNTVFEMLRPHQEARRSLPAGPPPAALVSKLRCPVCGQALAAREQSLNCPDCKRSFPVTGEVPVLHTEPGEEFPDRLEERLRLTFADDPQRVRDLLALDQKLAYELPAPLLEDQLLAGGPEGWEAGPGVELSGRPGGGVRLLCKAADPHIISPRLQRPLASLRGLSVTLASRRDPPGKETLQVFFKTLMRPAFWEPGSSLGTYQGDGSMQRIFLPLPGGAGFPPGDELLALRIDPCHQPALVEMQEIVIEGH